MSVISLRYSSMKLADLQAVFYTSPPKILDYIKKTYVSPGLLSNSKLTETSTLQLFERSFPDVPTVDRYETDPIVLQNLALREAHNQAHKILHRLVTITPEYADLNAKLFAADKKYGVGGARFAKYVNQLVEIHEANNVLDYGAGKGTLKSKINVDVREFEPSADMTLPRPADVVACIDVLEHVEPECLDAVLYDLRRVTLKGGFLAIASDPAVKILADGRNAHLIVQSLDWWYTKISSWFKIWQAVDAGGELFFQVTPKDSQRKLKLLKI